MEEKNNINSENQKVNTEENQKNEIAIKENTKPTKQIHEDEEIEEKVQNNTEEKIKDEKFKKSKESSKKQIKEMKEMYEKKKKLKIRIAVITSIILVIGLFVSTIFAFVNMNNDKIMSGISIAGIDMSGLTKEEATSKLNLIYNEKKEKEIGLKYQEYESTLNPTLMEVNYEIEKAVDEAYKIGKKDNIFINNYEILFTLIGKKNISVNMTLNEEVTKQ